MINNKKYAKINIIFEFIGFMIIICGLYFSYNLDYSFSVEITSWTIKVFCLMFLPMFFLYKYKKKEIESNIYFFISVKIFNNIFMPFFWWVFLMDILSTSMG